MAADNLRNIFLFNSKVEDLDCFFVLKVAGVSEENIKKMAAQLGVQVQNAEKSLVWNLKSSEQEFGSVKRQSIQLFAAAAAISFHFPKVKMALGKETSLEPLSPLNLSASAQLYLSHAGFSLAVANENRVLSLDEMQLLREQFLGRAQLLVRKGA